MFDLSEDDGKALNAVIARSVVDTTFRALLLRDPHEAIRQATGITVPKELRIRFVEQPNEVDALIVLPEFVEEQNSELSVEELESVAGGICWGTCGTTCDKSCDNTCAVTEISVLAD